MPIKDSGKSQTPVYLWLTIAQMYLISQYFLFLMTILKWETLKWVFLEYEELSQ